MGSSATDSRIAATDQARVRVASGRGSKFAEQGSILVSDKSTLKLGTDFNNISGTVTVNGATGIPYEDFRNLLADERAANEANNRLLADTLISTTGAGLVAPTAPGDAPDEQDTPADAGAGAFDKLKAWWADLSDTGRWTIIGLAGTGVVFLFFRKR